MSKIRIFVALAIGLFSASAFSQWYAGLGPGVANSRVGGSVGGLSLSANDSRSTSFKLYGGYQVTPNWGLELQYADLGRFGYTGCAGVICGTGSARVPANGAWPVRARCSCPTTTTCWPNWV